MKSVRRILCLLLLVVSNLVVVVVISAPASADPKYRACLGGWIIEVGVEECPDIDKPVPPGTPRTGGGRGGAGGLLPSLGGLLGGLTGGLLG
jgi:hypothetical protein